MKKSGFAVIGAILLGSALFAQLKVDVELMNVVATVTDEKGRYVEGLTANDFTILEDGEPLSMAHFSHSADLPVSVGVTLDSSGSMERKIGTATRAVERFIRAIHADDDIFLMTFSDRPSLRQDFTSDREKLARALRGVTVGGGTALYDALEESLSKIRKGGHEKKAILLITDGEDTSSRINFEEALLAVRESELIVYCVGISPAATTMSERTPNGGLPPQIPGGGGRGGRGGNSGPFPTGRGGSGGTINLPGIPFPIPLPIPGRRPFLASEFQRPSSGGVPPNRDTVDMDVLRGFADASGGRAWLLSGSWSDSRGNQVEEILDQIASELRSQYSIGYYPTHPLNDGKWHRIEIKPKNSRYLVRYRKEYFGK